MQPPTHDALQSTLASGQQNYRNLPLVVPATVTADIAMRLESIDQAHGTVVPDK
ncbi:MAG: hypothetical protein WBB89_01170 [Candidatus Acidiferrum sp.]